MRDKDIQEAFAQLLETVAVRMASAAAARARGEISEEQFADAVLETAQRIAPEIELPLRCGEFVSPAGTRKPEDFEPPWDHADGEADAGPDTEAIPEILTWILKQASRGEGSAPPAPEPEPPAAEAPDPPSPQSAPAPEAGDPGAAVRETEPPLVEAPLWELEDALADPRSAAPAPAADIFAHVPEDEPEILTRATPSAWAPVHTHATAYAAPQEIPAPAQEAEAGPAWDPETPEEAEIPQHALFPDFAAPESEPPAEPWDPADEAEDKGAGPLLVDQEWEPQADDPFAGLPLPPRESAWADAPAAPETSETATAFDMPGAAPKPEPLAQPHGPAPADAEDEDAGPLLVDQEWTPEEGDPFADLPLPPRESAWADSSPAPESAQASEAPAQAPDDGEPLLLEPGWSRPPEASGPLPKAAPRAKTPPAPEARSPRPASRGPRVLISGSAQWERDDSHELEDTMFRLGVEEDMAQTILDPQSGLTNKDRDFIAKETRRALEGGGKNRSPVAAFLLSLLLPGAGSAYVGRTLGVLFAVPALALGVFLGLGQITPRLALMGFIPLSILSACLAYLQAADENRLTKQRTQPPLRQGQRETTLRFPS